MGSVFPVGRYWVIWSKRRLLPVVVESTESVVGACAPRWSGRAGSLWPFVLSDSSVLELAFSEWPNLWNCGLWWQAPCTSLHHLLIARLGVSRVSLMIAYLSQYQLNCRASAMHCCWVPVISKEYFQNPRMGTQKQNTTPSHPGWIRSLGNPPAMAQRDVTRPHFVTFCL
jgi:hypothetical protein